MVGQEPVIGILGGNTPWAGHRTITVQAHTEGQFGIANPSTTMFLGGHWKDLRKTTWTREKHVKLHIDSNLSLWSNQGRLHFCNTDFWKTDLPCCMNTTIIWKWVGHQQFYRMHNLLYKTYIYSHSTWMHFRYWLQIKHCEGESICFPEDVGKLPLKYTFLLLVCKWSLFFTYTAVVDFAISYLSVSLLCPDDR